ncbi:MAG: flagellar basal body rod protein FlgC [Terracidiphilus sp.]
MNLFGMMETSGSAMEAERMRAEVVAANMANAETTRTESGGPYHRQHVVFAAGRGNGNAGGGFLDSLAAASDDASAGAAAPALLAALNLPGSGSVSTGVHIAQVVEDPSPPLKRYDPGHPDAGPDGYVSYPDINPLTEMVDLMGATRAYGLNGSAVQAEKGMISSALEIAKT